MNQRDQVEQVNDPARRKQRTEESDVDVPATAYAAAALSSGQTVSRQALPLLQRAAGNAAVAAAMEDVDGSLVHSVISGGGQPLAPAVQAVMEGQFGADFSDVRVHTDPRATQSAQAINAQAYTAGNDIVFQRQHFNPDTREGMHMLAHELTHVVQQRSGPVAGTPVAGNVSVSDPSDRFEQAAEHNADAVMNAIGGAPLQRHEVDEDL